MKSPIELDESTATKEIVRLGAAIACLPRRTVAGEVAARSLVELKQSASLQDLELRRGRGSPPAESARSEEAATAAFIIAPVTYDAARKAAVAF